MNQLFTVKSGKFRLSAQRRNLAPFVGNGTNVKMLYEIKLPLIDIIYVLKSLLKFATKYKVIFYTFHSFSRYQMFDARKQTTTKNHLFMSKVG